jgi:hypothetical protein
MNLKLFTLTTLFLCCFFKGNAQIVQTGTPFNEVDLLLKVKDSADTQKFELLTGADTYYSIPTDSLAMNIDLDYGATQNVTSYIRVKFKFTPDQIEGSVDNILRGITTPVLIPPVKKKKGEGNRPLNNVGFPFTTKAGYNILNINYTVTAIALKYNTQEDYMENNIENARDVASVNFSFITAAAVPITNEAVVITTFPNPITDHITIKYAVGSGGIQDVPLDVSIFDNNGIFVSQHTLTSSNIDATSISYYLDTSQLQAGIYFFQLVRNGGTTTRTIIKQ